MAKLTKQHRCSLRHAEAGVSIAEFVLVFPLFMLITIVIVDFGRASALRAVVDEAVNRTLVRATAIPNLDVNLPPTNPGQLDSGATEFKNLQLARELAANEGLQFLQAVQLLHVDTDANQAAANGAKLHDLVLQENRISDGPVDLALKLMVLRPGECAQVPSLGIAECNRVTLGLDPADPIPDRPVEQLMERHPIKVVAYATLDSYTPFLFNTPVRVEAYGYRQPIPQAPFPDPIAAANGIDPAAPAVAPPLPPFGRPVMPEEPPQQQICVPTSAASWELSISTARFRVRPQRPFESFAAPSGSGGVSDACAPIGL